MVGLFVAILIKKLSILAILLVGTLPVFAQSKVWTGNDTGNNKNRWQRDNNWSASGTPGATNPVLFNGSGDYLATLELRGNRSADSLTFDSAPSFALVNGNGSRTLTLTSGTVTTTASSTGDYGLNFTTLARSAPGDFIFNLNGSGTFSTAAEITGAERNLVQNGSGLLVLSANNTYSGLTTVNGGTLRITNAGALGTDASGTVVNSGGTLQLSGGITVANELLTLAGGSLQNHTGNNTWNGNLVLTAPSTLANLDSGSSLTLGTSGANRTFVNNGHTLTFEGVGNLFLNAQTSGTGGLVHNSTDTTTLSYGNNATFSTYSGPTLINRGTLVVDVGDNPTTPLLGPVTVGAADGSGSARLELHYIQQIGDSTSVRVNRTGSLALRADVYTATLNETIGPLTLEGGAFVETIDGTDPATFVLSDTVTRVAPGDTTAEIAGRLNLGGGNRVFNVANSAADVDLLISAIISQPFYSSLIKEGDGTLHLTAANTYTGETNINAGVLRVSHANALGTANFNNSVADGAALQFAGNFTLDETGLTLNGSGIGGTGALRSISGTNAYNGQLALNAAGASVGADSGATLSLGGAINGGTFTKVGDGTLVLTGGQAVNASSFVVNGGTVVLNRTANANLVNTAVNVQSGTLRLAANQQIADWSTVTLAPAGTFDLDGRNETIASLAMTGGNVTLGGGTLTLTANSAITSSAHSGPATIAGPGALNLTAFDATLNVADGPAAIDLDIASVISGNANLVKTGDGTLRLGNAANSYTGNTILNAGTVLVAPAAGNVGIAALGNNSHLGRGSITVNTGGTLDLSPTASNATFTGFNRSLTINGGTVRLSPGSQINTLIQGSNTLTFGPAGGLFDLDQRLNPNVALGNVQVDAALGTPGTIRYSTIAATNGNGGWNSGGRDINIANNTLAGPGHLRFELLDGAAVHYNQAHFGGTLTFAGPSTGNAAAGSTSTATGRLALDSQSVFTVAGGINFDGIMQVGLYNTARTLDTDITIRSGTTAFQGRGTGAAALDRLTLGSTVNGRTLTIQDGATARIDIGYRDDLSHNGGVILNAHSVIEAGGTLAFVHSNTSNTFGANEVHGRLTGQGVTGNDATVRLLTPVDTLPGSTPGTTYFASTATFEVNGAGAGGLRLEGTQARVDAFATDTRLAATTGTGGTLTLAYTDGGDRTLGTSANLTTASAVNLGLESDGGTFTLTGTLANWGGLTVGTNTSVTFDNDSVFDSADDLILAANASFNLNGTTQDFGDLIVLGDAIIDFAGGDSILNVNSVTIADGATLTLVNWIENLDFFFSNTNPGSDNLNRIVFSHNGERGSWDTFGQPFEITPVPEPSSYGALLLTTLATLTLARRPRR